MAFNSDSEALAEARAEVGRAVQRFFDVKNAEGTLSDDTPTQTGLYVDAWAVSASYTSAEYERDDVAAGGPIVPDGQSIATTVGLFVIGQQQFVN